MNEEIHDRFYDDIDGNKHFNSTQLVERYRCEGNGALCDMDCENCEFYKKFYTKEPCPYCRTDIDVESIPVDKSTSLTLLHTTMMIVMTVERFIGVSEVKIHYCPMCGRKLEDV